MWLTYIQEDLRDNIHDDVFYGYDTEESDGVFFNLRMRKRMKQLGHRKRRETSLELGLACPIMDQHHREQERAKVGE